MGLFIDGNKISETTTSKLNKQLKNKNKHQAPTKPKQGQIVNKQNQHTHIRVRVHVVTVLDHYRNRNVERVFR